MLRERGARALVLVIQMPNDAESAAAALELKSALSDVPTVGDRPHEEQIVTYSGAAALAEMVKVGSPAIIYFGPGFAKELTAIRVPCPTPSLLTVGATPDYVESGIVLGFDLVSGRPKLLINLEQARKQQVDFPASGAALDESLSLGLLESPLRRRWPLHACRTIASGRDPRHRWRRRPLLRVAESIRPHPRALSRRKAGPSPRLVPGVCWGSLPKPPQPAVNTRSNCQHRARSGAGEIRPSRNDGAAGLIGRIRKRKRGGRVPGWHPSLMGRCLEHDVLN